MRASWTFAPGYRAFAFPELARGYVAWVVDRAYKPLVLLAGLLGGLVAGAAFKRTWRLVADEDSPEATDRDRRFVEIIAAGAMKGAIVGVVRAMTDRAGARAFERRTGSWPGRTRTKKR